MIEMECCIEHIKQDRLEILLDDYKTQLFDDKVNRLAGKDSLSRKNSGISSISDDGSSGRDSINGGLSNRDYPSGSFDNTIDLKHAVKNFACCSFVDKTAGYTVDLAAEAKEADSMFTYLQLQTEVESGDSIRTNVDNANVDTTAAGLKSSIQKTEDTSSLLSSVDQRAETNKIVNTTKVAKEKKSVDIDVDSRSTKPTTFSLIEDNKLLTCVDKAENPAAFTGIKTDVGVDMGVDIDLDKERQQAANIIADCHSKQKQRFQRLEKSVKQLGSNLDKVANAAVITGVDAGVDKEVTPTTSINVDCRAKQHLNRIVQLANEPGSTSDNAANAAADTFVDKSVDKEAQPGTNINVDSKAAHPINEIVRSVRLHCFRQDKVAIAAADKCVDKDSKWNTKTIVDSGSQQHINGLEKSAKQDRVSVDNVLTSVAEKDLELYETEVNETIPSPMGVDNREISKMKEGQAGSMSFVMAENFNERNTTDNSSSTNSVSSSVRSCSSGVVSVGDEEDMFFDSNVEKKGSFTDSAIDIDFELPHRFSFMMAATSDL